MTDNEIMEKEKKPEDCFFRASAEDFKKIPGSPIAYWVSDNVRNVFIQNAKMEDIGHPCSGIQTGDNDRFLRQWFEVNFSFIGFEYKSIKEAGFSITHHWFPHKKGGEFRKWYGNNDYVLDWADGGKEILSNPSARPQNLLYMFKKGVTWSHTSSGNFGCRVSGEGFTFNVEAPTFFSDETLWNLGVLCSNSAKYFMELLNPTLHFLVGTVKGLPMPSSKEKKIQVEQLVDSLIDVGRWDWDSSETSWGFTRLPFLSSGYHQPSLKGAYQKLRDHWQEITLKMQRLEEENNAVFIEAYGLRDELTPDVHLNEITLTCNPHYRYGGNKTEEELEGLLLADTMREFISYAVGCVFGRYSLDKEGLILANQGETLQDYLKQVPEPSFMPDDDNVIPLIDFDGDWFEDDISERFKQFLKITFGEEHFQENLRFIEQAIGKTIKKFFVKEFYSDHIKRYKKRPIYWQFSSPKGTFNALIYMHRYHPDTVSIVLNDYLREFRTKITARQENLEQITISASASQKEKTQALKTIEKIKKVLDEINHYEHDVLYPLATQKIEIDLDDGVKHNYPLFGKALKKVAGLS